MAEKEEPDIGEGTDEEDFVIRWNRNLPRRIWLTTGVGEIWLLPDAEAAMARIATMAEAGEDVDLNLWTRTVARRMVGQMVTPLPMPEDLVGFFTVAAANHWLLGGWIH